MKKLRDFKCLTGHLTERLVNDNVSTITCPECKDWAGRVISTPRYLGNTTGKSPSRN